MNLPSEFVKKYQNLLGTDEAKQFLASFSEAPVKSFRVNPLKKYNHNLSEKMTDPVPFSHFGYYGEISGKSIEQTTGLIYSQEASAMLVAEVASSYLQKNSRVLDLCAAPGGKTTHLASFMKNNGLLVANEVDSKRAQTLVENIERCGVRNAVVVNEQPAKLAQKFPQFFDLILVDAPCSGEGMFRKDPEAVQYWDDHYPTKCAKRQRKILTEAIKMLTNDGILVYSTCTFAPEEDEQNVAWLLENYAEIELLEIPKVAGISSGFKEWANQKNGDLGKTARIFPHQFRGEGHFVALFIKKENSVESNPKLKKLPLLKINLIKKNLTSEQQQLWKNFSEQELITELTGVKYAFGQELYLVPNGMIDVTGLVVVRCGLHLGTFKKKRFVPSFALGNALSAEETKHQIELSAQSWKKYVGGETIELPEKPTNGNGWYQLLVNGNGFGFAKVVDRTVKNFYPKGLRFKL